MAHVRQTLRENDLAYLDTMYGLVACRVLRIWHRQGPYKAGTYGATSDVLCKVQITATKARYCRRGEIADEIWSLRVIPRKAIRGNRIMPYDVIVPDVEP